MKYITDNLTDTVLKVILVINAFLFTQKGSIIHLEIIWFYISSILLFLSSLFSTRKREFNYFCAENILLLFTVCFINLWLNNFNPEVIKYLVVLLITVFDIKIISEYSNGMREFYGVFFYTALCNVILYYFQLFGYDFVLRDTGKTELNGGFFNNLPRLTTYIAITFPLCFHYNKYLSLLLLPCLFIHYQALAIASIIIFFLFKLNRRYLILISIIIVEILIILIFIKYYSQFPIINKIFEKFNHLIIQKIPNRLNMMWVILQYSFLNGLNGTGLGILPDIMKRDLSQFDNTTNSSIFQFIMQCGVLSIAWIVSTLISFKKHFNKYSVVCLTVFSIIFMSILEYPFEINRMKLILITSISMYIIELVSVINYEKEYLK